MRRFHQTPILHTGGVYAKLGRWGVEYYVSKHYRHLGCLSNEGAGLYAKREGLTKELRSLNVAVSQMEVDIARLNADIGKLGMYII